jgi:hypothetical protein
MADTFSVGDGKVLFTFLAGPNQSQQVEITIGTEQRRVELWKFNLDLIRILEESARRSGFK